MRFIAFAVALAVAASVTGVSAALAYRQPTTSERMQIVAAIKQNMLSQGDSWCYGTAKGCAQITHIRISLADQSFASAAMYKASIGGALILLHKKYGTWRVTDLGSAFVGCADKAPKVVRVDLELKCPGGK